MIVPTTATGTAIATFVVVGMPPPPLPASLSAPSTPSRESAAGVGLVVDTVCGVGEDVVAIEGISVARGDSHAVVHERCASSVVAEVIYDG